jgi:signal peptidase II
MRRYQFLIVAAVVALDRLTKWLVIKHLPEGHDIAILPGVFQLSHWENTGAAFSMFADSSSPWRTLGLIGFAVIALLVVSFLLWKSGSALNSTTLALTLIMGGALGNLWDRVIRGTVTDFLDFYIAQHHWPPFNLADSAIVVGSVLLIWKIMLGPQRETRR